jgi:hypothetical protein
MKHSIMKKDLQIFQQRFHNKFRAIIKNDFSFFFDEPGKTPYLLLSYFANQFQNKTFIVTDAWRGFASLALMMNDSNTIHSFTNRPLLHPVIREQPNHIVYDNTDLLDPEQLEKNRELLLSSAIIFVDHSPHYGTDEYRLYEFLLKNEYQGIVISDHVWVHKSLRDHYWYKIPECYRYDLTEFGSEDGMTLYTFCKENLPFQMEQPDVSNWTLVTAYFNLTKCSDASDKIIERDINYYMEHAKSTLSLPYHLVIYCDEESLPIIQTIRPKEYADKTVYQIRNFEDLCFSTCPGVEIDDRKFAQYREKINQNRVEKPYEFDKRNTASYYLFCMSRYLMMIETIDQNPFGSTHFAWINFCIERMGYKNLVHLPECLLVNRDKFSTCYIDYIPQWYINITPLFYSRGVCSMCSGFFTGNAHYMRMTCKYIIEKFLYYLELGYGHADEQLYSPVYFDHPELFEHYYGDYTEMITNYKYIYARPEEPIKNIIQNSFRQMNYKRCMKVCEFILQSIAKKTCQLNEENMIKLRYYYTEATMKVLAESP